MHIWFFTWCASADGIIYASIWYFCINARNAVTWIVVGIILYCEPMEIKEKKRVGKEIEGGVTKDLNVEEREEQVK